MRTNASRRRDYLVVDGAPFRTGFSNGFYCVQLKNNFVVRRFRTARGTRKRRSVGGSSAGRTRVPGGRHSSTRAVEVQKASGKEEDKDPPGVRVYRPSRNYDDDKLSCHVTKAFSVRSYRLQPDVGRRNSMAQPALAYSFALSSLALHYFIVETCFELQPQHRDSSPPFPVSTNTLLLHTQPAFAQYTPRHRTSWLLKYRLSSLFSVRACLFLFVCLLVHDSPLPPSRSSGALVATLCLTGNKSRTW